MAASASRGTGKGGRPPKLNESQVVALRDLALAMPMASLDEVAAEFRRVHKVELTYQTVSKYLKAAGLVRVRPMRQRGAEAAATEAAMEAAGKKRYGYADRHRDPGDAVRYPSGLTDAEWALVADVFETNGPGKPPKYPRRIMVDACLYVVRTGASWRMLPKDFPPWKDVYATFRRWTTKGLFEQMHDRLRAMWREREHRALSPTGAVIDSQSVRTGPEGGPKGYDAGKKVKGRKRHLVTDTLGLLLAVFVSAASVQDRDGAAPTVARAMAKYPTIEKLYADRGYEGKRARELEGLHGLQVEIVRRPTNRTVGRWVDPQKPMFPPPPRFVVLPKRWIIERTNAWNDRPRRMARDHDRRIDVSESWIWLTEARILARRLTDPALASEVG